MKGLMKTTAALAAFALLLVVMGIGTQSTVNAQTQVTLTVTPGYVCTDTDGDDGANEMKDGCSPGNSVFTVTPTNAEPTTEVVIRHSGNNSPLTVTGDTSFTVKVLRKSNGLPVYHTGDDGIGPDADVYVAEPGDNQLPSDTEAAYHIGAFSGGTIRVSVTAGAGVIGATSKTVLVDNVKPALSVTSPAAGYVAKANEDIEFSARIIDSGAGFADFSNDDTIKDITLTGGNNVALTADNDTTPDDNLGKGGVRLVVAGTVVQLGKSAFTKVEDGWRVSASLNSDQISGVAHNVPWYFEVIDRAGNKSRTATNLAGKASAAGNAGGTSLIDDRFAGSMHAQAFAGSMVRINGEEFAPLVEGGDNATVTASIPPFDPDGDGEDPAVTLTFADGTEAKPVDKNYNPTVTSFDNGMGTFNFDAPEVEYEISGTYEVDHDNNADTDAVERTGKVMFKQATQIPKGADYHILGVRMVIIDNAAPEVDEVITGSAYDASKTGTARLLTGREGKAKANSILVKFDDRAGRGDDTPAGSGLDPDTVTPSAFTVAGNTVESVRTVGNDVYLTLGTALEPDETPVVTIVDGVIKDKAGNVVRGSRHASTGDVPVTDGLGPNLTLSRSAALSNKSVKVTITSDEPLQQAPIVHVTAQGEGGAAAADNDSRVGNVSYESETTYSYTHSAAGNDDGKYSVYATAVDREGGGNMGSVGNKSSATAGSSFTFQLDTQLNGNDNPIVKVGDDLVNGSAADGDSDDSGTAVPTSDPDVDQIAPLIVTVNFAGETDEYEGDSHKTVELQSAKLVVTLSNGTKETTTFDLDTEVSTQDNISYTIALAAPKTGDYELTVMAADSAGNTEVGGDDEMSFTWDVVAPMPARISLVPGWNLISLPFNAGNPAINSVIPADHPVDIVMTYDNVNQAWLVSRRDADSGNFMGDIPVMTASTAYFVRTTTFQDISVQRPPLATAAAAPPPPPAIPVVEGWNLVPVLTNDTSDKTIPADEYFGTLGGNWLKALTFNTRLRTWDTVSKAAEPGHNVTVGKGYWLYATADGVIIP